MDEQLIEKDQQFNGFRQVWTVRADGVFHGRCTVYWESGPVVCMQGQYKAGLQEGIWTYWNRAGELDKQIRFHRDEPVHERTEPPWLDDATDQRNTEPDAVQSSPTPESDRWAQPSSTPEFHQKPSEL